MIWKSMLCGLIAVLLLATTIATVEADNIRVVKNAEIVLGDRGNYIRVYDDQDLTDQRSNF